MGGSPVAGCDSCPRHTCQCTLPRGSHWGAHGDRRGSSSLSHIAEFAEVHVAGRLGETSAVWGWG